MSSELLGARIRLYRDVGGHGPAIVIAPTGREPILKGPTDTVSASLLLNKGCYWPAKEDQRRLSENIARGGLTLLEFETLEDALSCFSHLQERGAKLEGGPAANDLALNDLGDDFECVSVGRLFVPDLADSLAHATHCPDGAGYFVLGLSQL